LNEIKGWCSTDAVNVTFGVIHIHPTIQVSEITFIRKSAEMYFERTSVISLQMRANSEPEYFEILGYKGVVPIMSDAREQTTELCAFSSLQKYVQRSWKL
jgi:hypothetical protein